MSALTIEPFLREGHETIVEGGGTRVHGLAGHDGGSWLDKLAQGQGGFVLLLLLEFGFHASVVCLVVDDSHVRVGCFLSRVANNFSALVQKMPTKNLRIHSRMKEDFFR